MKKIAPLVLALILAACGGGGGGGGSGTAAGNGPATPANPPASSTGLSVTFDKSALNFAYNEGDAPPLQTLVGTATGSTDRDVLIGAEVNGSGISTPINVQVDMVRRTATASIYPLPNLAPGSYSGTIKVLACADQACTVQHGGSPYTLPYTITVRPGLKPSVTSLDLAAAETGSSGTSTIGFTPPAAGASVTASVDYANGYAGWLDAQVSGSQLLVRASAAALAPGSYQATIRLNAPSSGQTVAIPVKLTVGSGLTVPDGGAYKVTSMSRADLSGTVPLALAAGTSATAWTAASDQPWLKLSRAGGDFSTRPTWTIDMAAFDALPNNTHYTARITIATDSKLPSKVYVLDVHKALVELKGVDAVGLLAGQAGDVLIYGSGGFSNELQYGQYGVSFAGPAPTAVTNVNDKVIRLSLPAMQPGTYGVTLKSLSGLGTVNKQIVVRAGTTYAYQSFDTEGRKSTIVWDAVSKSAFVVNATLKSIMRYADVGGRFQLVATRSFPAVDSIAMNPDHTALVLQSNYNTIYKLAPADLSTLATFELGPYGGTPDNASTPLTIMGDNRLMHPLFGWIDLDTGAATPLGFDASSFGAAAWGAVSGDGNRMILPDSGRYTPRGPMYHADVGNPRFVPYKSDMTPYFYRYAVNHDGSVWWLEGDVVDFDLNLRGKAVLPDGWLANQAAMSRDGTRLYQFAQSATAGVKPRVWVLDTSRVMTTAVNLPVLGFIEFDDLPNCPYSPNTGYYDNCYTFETRMALADDGRTVFIAGDKKFVVVPVPANLAPGTGGSASASASRRMVVLPAARP